MESARMDTMFGRSREQTVPYTAFVEFKREILEQVQQIRHDITALQQQTHPVSRIGDAVETLQMQFEWASGRIKAMQDEILQESYENNYTQVMVGWAEDEINRVKDALPGAPLAHTHFADPLPETQSD